METSEKLPHGAVEASDLAELARSSGPFLSLYLNTEPDVENASQRSQARWKTKRSELETQDVPVALLDEIEGLVPEAHLEGNSLAVIGGVEQIVHTEHGPAESPNDEATWGPLPRLLPIIRWRQSEPPYVVVQIDRRGADLFGVRRGSPELHAEIEGDHNEIRKVQAGGWSQRRYQQRAEDSWEQNAEQVAAAVERLVLQVQPVFVAVVGDVRAVGLLRESLPKEVDALVHVIEKEIPRKLEEDDPVPEDVWALVQQHVRETGEGLLARFEEERGQKDKAVEGAAGTARALARAQVAVLLVADEGDEEAQLWFGPDPALLATSEQELKDLGVDSPEEEPARDVLVRAALGTGAGIRVLEGAPALHDGVGALLRWSTG
ncbi:MAG: Vms1/Ankzf1 family peptidyl-tRNA hydrolase [Actinomycetota bacterium]